ncbi:hypothetical protein A3C19_00795 [Candidatus Kaiserbacteria bacterium RIFCSPHIGHO2_02_FULL_54_22]|uniref:Uncharacterized protein n=1 Tax=Candidatus Kaiserbacteria bacterium RIFCSPHIGHO2_02_FULL_54_22 TaxID=1798495 RepID=A0A1F6DK61_9BACT|nr:MAG: hypothetical protein A3C19_00795 [Candidatus Kaiserbacteria bacterium RIFCSPHIGHO2_02_FULL_54_22]
MRDAGCQSCFRRLCCWSTDRERGEKRHKGTRGYARSYLNDRDETGRLVCCYVRESRYEINKGTRGYARSCLNNSNEIGCLFCSKASRLGWGEGSDEGGEEKSSTKGVFFHEYG